MEGLVFFCLRVAWNWCLFYIKKLDENLFYLVRNIMGFKHENKEEKKNEKGLIIYYTQMLLQ